MTNPQRRERQKKTKTRPIQSECDSQEETHMASIILCEVWIVDCAVKTVTDFEFGLKLLRHWLLFSVHEWESSFEWLDDVY